MKTAIIYDRVNKWGGAERVLLSLHEIFPEAPLFTSVYNPESAPWARVFPEVIPSFLQKIPFASNSHEYLAPLMPIAFESFNFDKFDLVISVTSEAAKGIITKPGTKHICYCLTPTRYLWSGYDEYFKSDAFRAVSRPIVGYLRKWDWIAGQRPDAMIAISTDVGSRIKKYYNRDSTIIFPPVDTQKFEARKSKPETNHKDEYFLVVSRLVSYKKVDLVIEVFNQLKWPLVVAGTGSEEKRLRDMAKGNIKFVGNLTDSKLVKYYKNAKALIFPQLEDFGMVAVEAQSCGIPVIAYKAGGALDTVVPGKTGVFFERQAKKDIITALNKFESMIFDSNIIIKNARRFSKDKFKRKFSKLIDNV